MMGHDLVVINTWSRNKRNSAISFNKFTCKCIKLKVSAVISATLSHLMLQREGYLAIIFIHDRDDIQSALSVGFLGFNISSILYW